MHVGMLLIKKSILVSRGGGGLEMLESYALYLDGEIIEVEGEEKFKGSRFNNDLKIYWTINKLIVNKIQLNKYSINELMQIVKEAFIAFSYCGLKKSQVLEVAVEINVELSDKREQNGINRSVNARRMYGLVRENV